MHRPLVRYSLALAAVLIIGAGVVHWSRLWDFRKAAAPAVTPETEAHIAAQLTPAVDMSAWPTYRNESLGVSFKYPPDTQAGHLVFFRGGSVLFVATASSSVVTHKDELSTETDVGVLSEASKLEDEYPAYGGGAWKIWVFDVYSDADLERVVQAWANELHDFKNGCTLGGKEESDVLGVYDVGIDPVRPGEDDKYDADSSCWINWRMAFKYSPEYHRAALWDIGQEGRFFLKDCDAISGCDADSLMADSFEFVDRR